MDSQKNIEMRSAHGAYQKNNSIIYKALISRILQRINLKTLFQALNSELRSALN
jgi:hypothetical protein